MNFPPINFAQGRLELDQPVISSRLEAMYPETGLAKFVLTFGDPPGLVTPSHQQATTLAVHMTQSGVLKLRADLDKLANDMGWLPLK